MVADDDLEMRQVVCEVLASAGFEVREASSGVVLLSRLVSDGDFDLMVTDVRMPWISGEHVVQMARTAGFGLPVLIMTAYADEALHRLLAGLENVALLEKPFDLRELVEATLRILGSP
ncbi:MAG TPA: response regulator [Polyangia bacterium]|nr:response regulator [Polyangia bacterium]